VAPDDAWSNAALLLRIAEATPGVRFCLAHSCRFDREYLDRIAALPNTWFDCSAHRIHCESAVRGLFNVAGPARRFAADYRDPAAVLRSLAQAYPRKLIWGSDSPFQSYVAVHQGVLLSLRSTYAEEAACLHALPQKTQIAIAHDNLLALLGLKDESILTRG
jgi:predicted TIM-barrel fold metal-dependent hydrolase